jgi:hypothetical protein
MLSRFGVLAKVIIDQGMKLCGDFQKLCEKALLPASIWWDIMAVVNLDDPLV